MERTGPPRAILRLAAGVVDLERGVLSTDHGPVELTEIEAELLRYLHRQRDRAVGRDELLERVWGYRPGVRSHTVESTIQRLRAKIELDPKAPEHLRTVRGTGYRLVASAPSLSEDVVLLEPIFGRDVELAAIRSWLDDGARLVTVTGPPGVGKTWLVRALLGTLGASGADIGFVDLTGLRTRTELAAAAAPPTRGVWVLDDVQDLEPDAVEELTRWLRRSPELALVVTAHARLAVEGEQTWPLGLLSVEDAVLVLRSRLRALGLAEPAPGVLERVAGRIERLPLALDVVAGSLETHDPEDLELTDLLDAPPVRRGARTLREAVVHTVDRLGPVLARSLSELAVFRSTFSAEVARAVLTDPAGLDGLRRRSLVRRLPDGRFALYDAVRSAVPADGSGAARRLADWLAARPHPTRAPPELAGHREDLVALIAGSALPEDRIVALVPLLGALAVRFGTIRGWETLEGVAERAGPAARAPLCWLVAVLHRADKRLEAADRFAALGLEADPDDGLASKLLVLRAQSATDIGDPDEAASFARGALARAEAGGTRWDQIRALQALGLARAAADPLEAYDILARAAGIARSIGDRRIEAGLWGTAAYARFAGGMYEEALGAAERSLALLGDDGDDRRVWAARGFRLLALALLDRCADLPRGIPLGAEHSTAYVYGQVLIALRDGDHPRAARYLDEMHDRMVQAGAEEAVAVHELVDILAGRRTDGSWWYAAVLARAASWAGPDEAISARTRSPADPGPH